MPGIRDSARRSANTPATASAPTASHAHPMSSRWTALLAPAADRARLKEVTVCAVSVMERSTGVHRIEMDRHHVDDEARDRNKEPRRERETRQPLVRSEPLSERVVEGHRHEHRDHEGHKHMNREQREIDRPDRAIAAKFR